MPVLTLEFGLHGRPVVELYASICSGEAKERHLEGNQIPPAVLVRALVDTGAGRSHLDLESLARLGIAPASEGLVHTASGGGPLTRDVYLVDLAFAGDRPGPLATDLQVFGSPLAEDLRVEMLL